MPTVYDVTKRDTFVKLETWLNELETYTTRIDLVKMLVGNKIDKVEPPLSPVHSLLIFDNQVFSEHARTEEVCFCFQDDREVDRQEGLKFARKHSMLFIGTYGRIRHAHLESRSHQMKLRAATTFPSDVRALIE